MSSSKFDHHQLSAKTAQEFSFGLADIPVLPVNAGNKGRERAVLPSVLYAVINLVQSG